MKKIIIIDNSSVITSMFKSTIRKELGMEVFVSKTIEDAKALLEHHTFFMAITNLYLVGANQSENLDLLALHTIPTIVFSSKKEARFLEQGTYPNIIDYVFKDTSGLKYIVRLIEAIEYCSHKKALVVDDSETTLNITKKMLQKISLNVVTAKDGQEALKVLESHHDISLIVSDYHMPTMDGLELVQKFRSDVKNSDIPILITTSEKDDSIKINLYKNGINDLIQKPVLEEELKFKLINLFLDKKHNEESFSQKQMIENYVITSATDANGIITHVSEAFCRISGYNKEELIGKSHSILRHPDMSDALYQDMWSTITSGGVWRGEVKNRKLNGEHYWVDAIIEPVFDNENNIKGYYAIRLDITDKKTIEEISITDGLTNIFNRRHFNDTFPKIINSAKRADALVCFLLMDIDHFKQYNDNYGHQMGDDVLIKFAACLKENLKRAEDIPFRLGGEEFGIIYKIETKEKAVAFANSVKEAIEDLKMIHEYSSVSNYITASMGLVCKKASQIKDMDTIYKETDDLLYASKESGRNKVTVNTD
jgi:diguanylate cyclase (GGDEF)-like protein/PAS domain S-box-containing protein